MAHKQTQARTHMHLKNVGSEMLLNMSSNSFSAVLYGHQWIVENVPLYGILCRK